MIRRTKNYFQSWENIDLITIGTFAALIRVSGYLITICGGGLNPLAFILKNIMITCLMVVLCYKVNRFGVITLYVTVTYLFSMILTGSVHIGLVTMLTCALLADFVLHYGKRLNKAFAVLSGVIFYEITAKLSGFAVAALYSREEWKLMIFPLIAVSIGLLGSIIGLPFGILLLKELRHAGIVRN